MFNKVIILIKIMIYPFYKTSQKSEFCHSPFNIRKSKNKKKSISVFVLGEKKIKMEGKVLNPCMDSSRMK